MTSMDRMLLAADALCQRYNVLPSEFFSSGDTLDFLVAQIGAGYQNHVAKLNKEGIDPSKGYYHGKSQDELIAMMENADAHSRQKQNNSKAE